MVRAAAVVPKVMGNHKVKGTVERMEAQEASHKFHNKEMAPGMVVHAGESHCHDDDFDLDEAERPG